MTNPVQTPASGTAVSTSATTNPLTSAVTSGNGVYVVVGYSGPSGETLTSVTDDKSNTYLITKDIYDSSSNIHLAVASAFGLTNGPKTFTALKPSSGRIDVVGYEVTGAVSVDVGTNSTHSFSSGAVNMAFTTAAASEFAVIAVAASGPATSYTQNNGWTQDYSDIASLNYFFVFSNNLAAAGSNGCNVTPNTGTISTWVILTGLPGGGASPSLSSLTRTNPGPGISPVSRNQFRSFPFNLAIPPPVVLSAAEIGYSLTLETVNFLQATPPLAVSSLNPANLGPSLAAPFNNNQFRQSPLSNFASPPASLSAQTVTYSLTVEGVTLLASYTPLSAQMLPFSLTLENMTFSGTGIKGAGAGGGGLGLDLSAGFFLN